MTRCRGRSCSPCRRATGSRPDAEPSTGGGDDAYGDEAGVRGPDRRLRAGRADRHRLPVHRGADLAPARAVPAILRHAGRRAPALGPAQRRARGAPAVQQMQRHDLRRRAQPDRLRARDLEPRARATRRAARGAGLAFRGSRAQQPERRLRALRRLDLFQRSLVRPHAGLRRRAAAPARLPGRLPGRVGPRRATASRRPLPVRPAERALLLPDRAAPLRQRHRTGADPRLRREARRHARRSARPRLRERHPLRARAGRPGRHEVRPARQRLGHRAGRRLGLFAGGRASRQSEGAGARRQPCLGRPGLPHALCLRDALGLFGADQGRAAAGALYAAARRRGRRLGRVVAPAARVGIGDRGGGRQDAPRPAPLRAHHPGHAERRGDGGRRLRLVRFAGAMPASRT